MSTKPKKEKNVKTQINDQPKRHIVLSGKRSIVGIEDKSDLSTDYEKDDHFKNYLKNMRCTKEENISKNLLV